MMLCWYCQQEMVVAPPEGIFKGLPGIKRWQCSKCGGNLAEWTETVYLDDDGNETAKKDFRLNVSYDIPDSGLYEHDLLAQELVGPEAKTMSFGSFGVPVMTRRGFVHRRTLEYEFPTTAALVLAKERFKPHKQFRVSQND